MHRIAAVMRGVSKLLFALAIVAALASVLAACGGGESDSSTTASPATQESTAITTTDGNGGQGNEGGGDSGSSSFRTPGGDNSIQNFGEEGDAGELAAATAALGTFMKARAEDEWARVCASLAKTAVAPLEELAKNSPQLKGKGCAALLAALVGTTPASTRVNTLIGPVASLRFEGDQGFALYHGPKGVNYFIPMAKEDGEWKVGSLAPTEFP